MKLSEQWLRQWVNPALSTQEMVDQITMAGLEVDAVEPVAGSFSGVVVGEIISLEQHPDADKLRVCQVNAGNDTVQVVCGAANAATGLKVPFATVGAILPGNFKIKKAKLRGVESFGMLCAEQELGLAEKSDGLMELPGDAPVGADIRDYLGLDDTVIEVDLTPNRADCLSVRGIAREVGVLNKAPVNGPDINPVPATIDDSFPITVLAAADCPRYVGRVIRDIDISKPTPLWMAERLRRAGLRSIDAVVDITNYVLLELGQPLHAFDLNKLQDGIVVRAAAAQEKLLLLNGQTLELNAGDLVIADHQQPLALAGIMGGEESAVNADTVDIFLESAFFAPEKLAGRARSYGLHTDSSHRFERGVDFALQAVAAERATQLIIDITGGKPGPILEVSDMAQQPDLPMISLRRARITRLLGFDLPDTEVADILGRLGMKVTTADDGWLVTPPSWRFDIRIEADLLEELARVYGYNRLPVSAITADLELRSQPETQTALALLRRQLVARGYQEVITYSFIAPELQRLFDPELASVEVSNPISADLSVMRSTLLPSLVNTASYNLKRQQARVRLFETGLTFIPNDSGLPTQEAVLGGLITGRRYTESWSESGETVDFYDLKGDIEALLDATRCQAVRFERCTHPALHPGRCASVFVDENNVGVVGALHPQLQQSLDIAQPIYVFELKLSAVTTGKLPDFTELSKYPEVRRDLAILIDRETAAGEVLAAVKTVAGDTLKNLRLFDIYQGEGIDPKRKSLALGLTLQHSSRTLNDEEVNATIDAVVDMLKTQFGGDLRI